ncbi:MAG TPA: GGDEF domain-containing protein [Gammaproteobacteria bacterium]|jgi:diguanylate cyclase (GGDEF)-like protein|nr:GGDEF domain-containing protein [Gammaproteobacteria bacterium]
MSQTQFADMPSAPSYDALTLTLTRPAFTEALRMQAEHAQRSGNPFCLLLLDVDHLQNINDCHGLAAGDDVLSGLADRARDVICQPAWHRSEYTLARFDGGALIVLARPCASSQAEMLAEALRFAVAEKPVSDRISATVSIGVAQFRIGEAIDELVARTERALHVAKQFGRDRVEVAHTPPSRPVRAKVVGLYD